MTAELAIDKISRILHEYVNDAYDDTDNDPMEDIWCIVDRYQWEHKLNEPVTEKE